MPKKFGMPPTRGHDLKQAEPKSEGRVGGDAPHTGARLETTLLQI